eukprot:GHUV01054096.1.p1 GENE.GHUV01054096.1~~GHUV01054096.1.p1  ORF type:complete len:108 (-),score=14.47 GHUV01054096.1:176-499(-)
MSYKEWYAGSQVLCRCCACSNSDTNPASTLPSVVLWLAYSSPAHAHRFTCCCLQSPAAYASPESAVCCRLLVKLLADYLNEVAYPAELAGLSYSISNHLAGFQVRCL